MKARLIRFLLRLLDAETAYVARLRPDLVDSFAARTCTGAPKSDLEAAYYLGVQDTVRKLRKDFVEIQ